ncbi:hypothetical protein CCH79_00012427, partial [Gambusia affinis]
MKAVKAFIDSTEVVVIGFLENEESLGYEELLAVSQKVDFVPAAICTVKDVWADFNITSGTISLFRKGHRCFCDDDDDDGDDDDDDDDDSNFVPRIYLVIQADNHQENLVLGEVKTLNSDGLVNFISINEVRYITEYDQVTAVGLFNSEVKTHLVLFANKGSKEFTELKERLGALAPEFTGKFLFVLINGGIKSNFKSLNYFGLKSTDLPRVGIYDGHSDMKWLLPEGEISTERVRDFCQSFLKGEL